MVSNHTLSKFGREASMLMATHYLHCNDKPAHKAPLLKLPIHLLTQELNKSLEQKACMSSYHKTCFTLDTHTDSRPGRVGMLRRVIGVQSQHSAVAAVKVMSCNCVQWTWKLQAI